MRTEHYLLKPVCLYFNLTNACNSACIFCASDSQSVIQKDIPIESIRSAFSSYSINEYDEIILNGGEPTIYPYLESIIQEVIDRGARVTLFTNGRLLHRFDYAQKILIPGLHRISIPVYGYRAKTHDRMTCRPGSFDQTLQGIRNVFSIRHKTGYPRQLELKLLAAQPVLPEWPQTVDLIANDLGLPDRILLSGLIISKSTLALIDQLIPSMWELRCQVNETLKRLKSWNIPYFLWCIPLCILDTENMDSLPNLSSASTNNTSVSYEIYFDSFYREGIEIKSVKPTLIPDVCRNCRFSAQCNMETDFFAHVIKASNAGNISTLYFEDK